MVARPEILGAKRFSERGDGLPLWGSLAHRQEVQISPQVYPVGHIRLAVLHAGVLPKSDLRHRTWVGADGLLPRALQLVRHASSTGLRLPLPVHRKLYDLLIDDSPLLLPDGPH